MIGYAPPRPTHRYGKDTMIYYFAVTAYSTSGAESGYSDEVSYQA